MTNFEEAEDRRSAPVADPLSQTEGLAKPVSLYSDRPLDIDQLARSVARNELSIDHAKETLSAAERAELLGCLKRAYVKHQKVAEYAKRNSLYASVFLELGYEIASQLESPVELFTFALHLGQYLCNEGDDVERGLELLAQARSLTRSAGIGDDDALHIGLLMADICFRYAQKHRSSFEAAASAYQSVLDSADNPKVVSDRVRSFRARAFQGLARCRLCVDPINGPAEAIDIFQKALQLVDERGDPSLYAELLHDLGNAHRARSSVDYNNDYPEEGSSLFQVGELASTSPAMR